MGLASYVTAFLRVFRHPVHTGRRGRPRLVLEEGLLLGQVVKRYVQRRVVSVERRVVRGTEAAIAAVLAATHSGTGINTAYIERLNATFRASLAPLVRRGAPSPTPRRPDRGDVAGRGVRITSAGCMRASALASAGRSPLEVARAHTSDGRRPDGPSLDHARAVALPSATASLGSSQTPRASPQASTSTGYGRAA